MNGKYSDEYIDNYLKGQLETSEQIAFEQYLQTDNALSQRLETERMIVARIELLGRKEIVGTVRRIEQQLAKKSFFKDLEKKTTTPSLNTTDLKEKVKSIDRKLAKEDFFKNLEKKEATKVVQHPSSYRKMLSIAASFALILSAGWWIMNNNNTNSLLDQPIAYQDVLSSKLQQTTGFTEQPSYYQYLETGIQAYNSKNFEQAISYFDTYLKEADKEDTYRVYAIFYKGLAQIEQAQVQAGIMSLEQVTDQEYFELKEDAKWLLVLSYLKYQGDSKEARTQANTYLLDLSKKGKYKEKAISLLKQF